MSVADNSKSLRPQTAHEIISDRIKAFWGERKHKRSYIKQYLLNFLHVFFILLGLGFSGDLKSLGAANGRIFAVEDSRFRFAKGYSLSERVPLYSLFSI